MSETTYYQRNRGVILNRAKDYYENNKELLREREREQRINIKREYGKKRYHKMTEENKKRLKEYQKNYREVFSSANANMSVKACYKYIFCLFF